MTVNNPKTLSIPFVVIVLVVFLGINITEGRGTLLLGGLAGVAYIVVILKQPLIHFFFLVLASVSFFGYLNPQEHLHLPGFFKIDDIMLCLVGLLFCLKVYESGCQLNYKNLESSSEGKKYLYAILILTLVQLIITSFKYSLPIISSVKTGRVYLYFFIAIWLLQNFKSEKHITAIVRFILILGVLQSILTILQYLFPGHSFLGYTKVMQLNVGADHVTRVYAPAAYYVNASFILSFWLLYFKNYRFFSRNILVMIAAICCCSMILSFQRTTWVLAILSVLLPLVVLNIEQIFRYLFAGIYVIGIVFVFLNLWNPDLIDKMGTRALSIYTETVNYEGNFAVRFEENTKRIDVIKSNIIFGPGFVHPDYAPYIFGFHEVEGRRASLQTNDSGILTLLSAFGLIGVFWVLGILKLVYKRAKIALKGNDKNMALKVGVASFVWSTWLTSLTTTGFTFSRGIIVFAVFMFLTDALEEDRQIILDKKKETVC